MNSQPSRDDFGERLTGARAHEETLRQLLAAQNGLFAYILKLLPNANDAADVLQQSNATILEKLDEYEPGTNFHAWVGRIAYYQVLTHRAKQTREKLVFDSTLLARIAERGPDLIAEYSGRLELLEQCMKKLSDADRQLLDDRYGAGFPPRRIAELRQRPAPSVSQSLYRVRTALMHCVEGLLASRRQANV